MSGRKVKCRVTGEFIPQSEAHKVVNNGKNEYYKSEEIYIDNVVNRARFINGMKRLLKVQENAKMPIQFYTKLKSWVGDGYSYQNAIDAVMIRKGAINYSLSSNKTRSFDHKLMYIMKIVEGALTTAKEAEKVKVKAKASTADFNVDLMNDMADLIEELKVMKKKRDSIEKFL